MAKNRYIGDYPVIGIRPCIDGRRGPMMLRESLEDQTMAMAKAAKKLFEENLYYSNGEPVKVVIADTTLSCEENAEVLRDYYLENNGKILVIAKENCDHHPHGLEDNTPLIEFIENL